MTQLDQLRINQTRFLTDFEALAQIGATGDGGVHRPALGVAHLAARNWFRQQVEAAGLQFRADAAGNHSAFLACGPADAPTLLLGSHLDSVPYGGRFDGPLGVLAALEVLRVVKDIELSLPVNLEAIDFTDEEGTLVGELGSSALAGLLTPEALQRPRGGRDALLAALARAGLTEGGILGARRDPALLAGYLELHIEQGARLLESQIDVGVVTSIVGISSCRLIFAGRADHAGTTPLDRRQDAALGASAFTLAVPSMVRQFANCTANVGHMQFSPGAFNIVPERVSLALEYRAPDATLMRQLGEVLKAEARVAAERYGLRLDCEPLDDIEPALMDGRIQQLLTAAADRLELSHCRLPSFAGHDGQVLAAVCPVGMVFVPSVAGASHSSRELTHWSDCINGANVLLQAAVHFQEPIGEIG